MATLQHNPVTTLSPALQKLLDDYMVWRFQDTPESASLAGFHDHDDRLDDMSLQAYDNRRDRCQEFLERTKTVEDKLTHHADFVNHKILQIELRTFIDGFPFRGFLMPLCYLSGVHMDFELLVSWMVFKTADDYRKLLSRMESLPEQMKQIQELMKEGIKKGIVNHSSSLVGVTESLTRFIVESAEESPLWKYFETLPDSVLPDDVADIQTRAKILITGQLSESFKELRNFTENYKISTRSSPAISSLPNGDGVYRQLVRFHTTTNMNPEEIHRLGKSEVARIEKEMEKIISELGYDMTVSDFSSFIRSDEKFYFSNPEDLVLEIKRLIHEVIAPRLPDIFTAVPKTELRVVADPSPNGTLAFYQPVPIDGSRPGLYKVNTQLFTAQPKYDLLTLSLHEGNPGHHLHSAYLLESPNMPLFRKVIEDRNYPQAPSRFPLYTAFMEGWALYAESLGFDMNLFQDPFDRYGHFSNEIYRACRLVVDTGLHCFGWTREEAVTYMAHHTALALENIENEVTRYITLPGQALAYKIGQLKIQELRQNAASSLGKNFSLKEFHDVVLSASGPLDLLEDEVNAWIEARTSASP